MKKRTHLCGLINKTVNVKDDESFNKLVILKLRTWVELRAEDISVYTAILQHMHLFCLLLSCDTLVKSLNFMFQESWGNRSDSQTEAVEDSIWLLYTSSATRGQAIIGSQDDLLFRLLVDILIDIISSITLSEHRNQQQYLSSHCTTC